MLTLDEDGNLECTHSDMHVEVLEDDDGYTHEAYICNKCDEVIEDMFPEADRAEALAELSENQ